MGESAEVPELERKSVHILDTEISFLEAGTGDPVLFIHGWPTNAHLWRQILPAVAARGRRAIAIDLPGFGHSDKPAVSYSFPYFERILSAFLDHIEAPKIGLAVHDLGGPIGVYWMTRNTQRVSQLALLNTLLFPQMSWAVVAFVTATRLPLVRSWLASPGGIRWAMRFGVADKSRIDDQVAALYQAPYRDQAARRALLAAGHGLHPGGFKAIEDALPTIDVPTRIVYGVNDRILPDVAKTMRRAAELLPATATALDNAGHFLQEDRPTEVAALLADFFDRS